MKRPLLLVIACLCVEPALANKDLDRTASSLRGQPLSAAIAKLGVPTGKFDMPGGTAYSWAIDHVYYYGPEELKCEIRAITDQAGIIGQSEADGNQYACTRLLKRINDRSK